ncbi:MAG: lysophospholipid acyltransferase family protein [Gemmatimonadaceae bacterium]|nr:lysophospholipid acyltransferase family protein [Gemmatimonadaceae bacterium]
MTGTAAAAARESRPLDAPLPPAEALASLTPLQRRLLALSARQQVGWRHAAWWSWRKHFGARAVRVMLARPALVTGWEHIAAADHARPLLLLANHRSYFDFFVLSTVMLERAPWVRQMHFPIKASYCYHDVGGAVTNALGAGFAAFPPFFRDPAHAALDAWALDVLQGWCTTGAGRVVGLHPEGTRNTNPDPWHLLPAQPGTGRLLMETDVQAIPVFIAGLGNSYLAQRRAGRSGARVRIHVGAPIDRAAFAGLPSRARNWVGVGTQVMQRIQQLADADRAAHG